MPVRPKTPVAAVKTQSSKSLGPFAGVAQDGPARKQRPLALAEELLSRGCKFIESGLWDEAEKEFRKALKLAADYPEAYSNLGLSLLYDGRPAEAHEALQEAVRMYPGWSMSEANLALALQRLARHDEAAHYYRLSLSHKTQQPQVWLSLGDALNALGKIDDAQQAFEQAVEQLPEYALAHQRLGMLQAKRGNLIAAESALQHAVSLNAGLDESHALLGAIAARRGSIAQAQACFKRIASEPLPAAAARGVRRIALFEAGARKALAEWKETQAAPRKLAECYFDLGVALLGAGNESEAAGAFRKSAQADPGGAPQQLVLALLDAVQGEALGAKAALERLAARDPQNGVVPEQLGLIALAMGLSKEAEAQFKKAQALGRELPQEINGES